LAVAVGSEFSRTAGKAFLTGFTGLAGLLF
jgi:hypothetical protein